MKGKLAIRNLEKKNCRADNLSTLSLKENLDPLPPSQTYPHTGLCGALLEISFQIFEGHWNFDILIRNIVGLIVAL